MISTVPLKTATIAVVSVAGIGAVVALGSAYLQKAKCDIVVFDEEEEKEEVKLEARESDDYEETERRREFIREMAREAWSAHCKYAWGQDVLLPHKREAFNFWFGPCSGHTMITALSTLWIMDFKDEFRRAKLWVENKFDLSRVKQHWDVKDTVEDYVGSFLSCYALTGEKVFLDRAKEVADAMAPAYLASTGKFWRKSSSGT